MIYTRPANTLYPGNREAIKRYMPEKHELVYNEHERKILVTAGDKSVELYSDVDLKEFRLIDEVDAFVSETAGLFDELIQATIGQNQLIRQGSYFDKLGGLQQKAARQYKRCIEYQNDLSEVDSEAVAAQLEQLYKANKFLKHYFRALTIAQSLAFSQRLAIHYTETEDYLYLYSFVRNVCSTLEYLGNLMESRMGEGKIDLDDKSVNAFDVYEELKVQELDEVFNPEQEMVIPPTNQKMKQGNIGISTRSMKYLWDKRCDIVHDCPLVIPEADVDHLPEEIVSTNVITTSDAKKVAHLSFRIHFQCVSMFLNFALSYLKNQITAMVKAWYLEQES